MSYFCLYGESTPPTDLNDRIRDQNFGTQDNPILVVELDMKEYIETEPVRYATASRSPLVQKFFGLDGVG